MEKLTFLIQEIKEGKDENFILLLKKMEPLIKKYTRLLYKDEREDVNSELITSLWEAVLRIKYLENDAQVMTFLCIALRNKYLELYKRSRKLHDHENMNEEANSVDFVFIENQYSDVLIELDVNNFLNQFSGIRREIYYSIAVRNLTDVQIANRFHVSRQYVNRVRRYLRKDFVEKYLNTSMKVYERRNRNY